jgi:hypothetical protein
MRLRARVRARSVALAMAFACTMMGCTTGPTLVVAPMLEVASFQAGTGAVTADGARDALSGTWEGRAWQGDDSWLLTVTFRGGSFEGQVQYPDRRCSGAWKLHASEPKHWEGDELIKSDPLRHCADHGRVSLELSDDDTLSFRWTLRGASASATLERPAH